MMASLIMMGVGDTLLINARHLIEAGHAMGMQRFLSCSCRHEMMNVLFLTYTPVSGWLEHLVETLQDKYLTKQICQEENLQHLVPFVNEMYLDLYSTDPAQGVYTKCFNAKD